MENPQDIQRQIKELKTQFAEFSGQMQKAVQDSQAELIKDVKTEFEKAVNGGEKTNGSKIKDWLAPLTPLIPAVTTIAALVIGYFIWQNQNEIQQGNWKDQQDIQRQNGQNDKKFATRLAITEEFYKRKLNIYENINQQMTKLLDRNAPKDFTDSLTALSAVKETQKLYISDDIADSVDKLCGKTIDLYQNNGDESVVKNAVEDVHAKMRIEVKSIVDNLNTDALSPNASGIR